MAACNKRKGLRTIHIYIYIIIRAVSPPPHGDCAIYWEMTSDNGIIIIIVKKNRIKTVGRGSRGEGTAVAARTLAGPKHRRRRRQLSHDFRISPCI